MSELRDLYDGMIPGAEPWADMAEREAIVKSIRNALFDMGYVIGMEMHPPIPTARQLRTLLESFKLTPSVAAWVLEGGEQ